MKKSLVLNLFLIILLAAVALLLTLTRDNGEAPADDAEPDEDEPAYNLPVVAFTPSGQFTEDDRALLWSHVVTPLADYNACLDQQVVSVQIEILDEPIVITNTVYEYGVDAMLANPDGSQNAITESFLHGATDGEMDYWVPALILKKCVDTLPNADDVRNQAVDDYQG